MHGANPYEGPWFDAPSPHLTVIFQYHIFIWMSISIYTYPEDARWYHPLRDLSTPSHLKALQQTHLEKRPQVTKPQIHLTLVSFFQMTHRLITKITKRTNQPNKELILYSNCIPTLFSKLTSSEHCFNLLAFKIIFKSCPELWKPHQLTELTIYILNRHLTMLTLLNVSAGGLCVFI